MGNEVCHLGSGNISPYHTTCTSLISEEYNPSEAPGKSLPHGYPGAVSHCPRENPPTYFTGGYSPGFPGMFHTMIKPQGNRTELYC